MLQNGPLVEVLTFHRAESPVTPVTPPPPLHGKYICCFQTDEGGEGGEERNLWSDLCRSPPGVKAAAGRPGWITSTKTSRLIQLDSYCTLDRERPSFCGSHHNIPIFFIYKEHKLNMWFNDHFFLCTVISVQYFVSAAKDLKRLTFRVE